MYDDEIHRHLKVLQGGFKRLCEAKVDQEAKLVSMDSLLRSVVTTLERIEIRGGKQPEQPEISRQSPQVSSCFALPFRS